MLLKDYNTRLLELLAGMVHGLPVRVVLSQRLKQPLVVQAEMRTLLLDENAGLYDLLLGAALLERRQEMRRKPASNPLPRLVSRWVSEARLKLKQQFPGVERHHGLLHPLLRAESQSPGMVWREVEIRPLNDGISCKNGADLGLLSLGDVTVKGAEGDRGALIQAVMEGRVPMQNLPEPRELPVVTVPCTISEAGFWSPEWEKRCDEWRGIADCARGYQDCYVRRSEGIEPRRQSARRSTGVRVDPSRLALSMAAARTASLAKPFQLSRRQVIKAFRPEEHLAVIGFDVNSFRRGATLDNPGSNQGVLWITIMMYLELRINVIVMAFADEILNLPDGRDVYVHIPMVLKTVNDPVDASFWRRLQRAIFLHDGASGVSIGANIAAHQPLQLATLAKLFAEETRKARYRNFAMSYHGTAWLPVPGVSPRAPHYQARVSQAFDAIGTKLTETYPGRWLCRLSLPRQIKDRAPRGGFIRKMLAI